MKYTLAVLALLSVVSAEQIKEQKVTPFVDDDGYVVMKQEVVRRNKKSKKTRAKDLPSNEICDGDSADDKQLEHTADTSDDIVEDTGFSGSRGHTIRAQLARKSLAQKKHRDFNLGRYSNDLANGDISDDKELEDVHDAHDDIVEDHGFSGSRGHTAYRSTPQFKAAFAQISNMSNQQLNAMLNNRMKLKSKDKPSEYLADGDSADDKQLNDAADNDGIVEDFGFSGSRNVRGDTRMLQTQIDMMSTSQLNSMLNARSKVQSKDKPSDYMCDGDSADDKQIYDAADPEDTIVEDFGFSGSRNARGQVRLLQTESQIQGAGDGYIGNLGRYSNEIPNGDHADDKELEKENDPTDDIVDFNGHTNAGYRHTPYDPYDTLDRNDQMKFYAYDKQHYATNTITDLFPDHFATKPRDDSFMQAPSSKSLLGFDDYPINQEHMNLMYNVNKPSDELANGDSADDKELQWEHDPNDPIVDYNGHTNAGYGHTRYDDPEDFHKFDKAHYENNHISALFPEHFGTVPKGATSGKYFG